MSRTIKLLFVTPDLNLGGTNSSLVSIIDLLSNNASYETKVFPISHSGKFAVIDKSQLISEHRLLSAYYGNYSELKGFTKSLALIAKPIKRIVNALHISCLNSVLLGSAIRHAEKQFSADYVVAFQEGYSSYLVGQWEGVHRIAWIHCDYNRYLKDGKSEESLYASFDKIICVSRFTADIFRGRYPFLSSKTTSVYNPFDYKRIQVLSNECITDSKFVASGFTIISIGRIDPIKRFSLIPSIAKDLRKKEISFKWYIIGPCTSESEFNLIQNNIAKEEVSDDVICLGGKSNPYPYLKQSSVLVCLSKSEACPMIFNEAKLLHLNIVSSKFGSASEFIDGNTDFEQIVPIEAISDALMNIYKQNTRPIGRGLGYFEEHNARIYSQLINLFI